MSGQLQRAVVLIDGVHKADNSIDGIRRLAERHAFVPIRLVWIGGTEKMKDRESFSEEFRRAFAVEIIFEGNLETGAASPVEGLHRALETHDIELVVQLSGSPQVNRRLMNRLAAVAVGYGAAYIAGGTVFCEHHSEMQADKPSLGLYATDKRVGKTAFGIYFAALMSGLRGKSTPWSAINITHSRGGPPEPPVLAIHQRAGDNRPAAELTVDEIYARRFRPEFLERLVSFGLHGASDVYEDALILSEYLNGYEAAVGAGAVPQMYVVGCRRAGAGYFHEFAVSNVELGLERANRLPGNFILHEGSGGEHPPVRVDGTALLVPADADQELLEDFPGLDTTDLVILAHCQPETATAESIAAIERVIRSRCRQAPILRTFFEPEVIGGPSELLPLRGKRVACFTTAPPKVEGRIRLALERDYGVRVGWMSFTLARHQAMREDIDRMMGAAAPPEAFLIEIKARGVEGAKYIRERYGVPVHYINNIPRHVGPDGLPMPDNRELDHAILQMLNRAVERFNHRRGESFPLSAL